MPKWLKDILTDDTGVNFTPDKVGMVGAIAAGIFGIFALIVIQALAVFVKGQEFHADTFGVGMAASIGAVGALITAGGGAMWLASRQKPTTPSQ